MLFGAIYHQRLSACSIESLICLNSLGGHCTEHHLAYKKQASQGYSRGGEGWNGIAAVKSLHCRTCHRTRPAIFGLGCVADSKQGHEHVGIEVMARVRNQSLPSRTSKSWPISFFSSAIRRRGMQKEKDA